MRILLRLTRNQTKYTYESERILLSWPTDIISMYTSCIPMNSLLNDANKAFAPIHTHTHIAHIVGWQNQDHRDAPNREPSIQIFNKSSYVVLLAYTELHLYSADCFAVCMQKICSAVLSFFFSMFLLYFARFAKFIYMCVYLLQSHKLGEKKAQSER